MSTLLFYRVSSPRERQQTKWVVYAVTASVAGDFLTHPPWQIFNMPRGTDLDVRKGQHRTFERLKRWRVSAGR